MIAFQRSLHRRVWMTLLIALPLLLTLALVKRAGQARVVAPTAGGAP